MGNLTYSGVRYWDSTEAASIPAATLALAQSVNDRLIGKFASGTARDSALATLSSDQKKGALYWVEGVGWSAHDGSVSREVMVRGVNFNRGRLDTTIEGNGYARLPSSVCFFQGGPPSVITATGINEQYRPTWDGTVDGAGALLKVYKPDNTQWGSGSAVACYWTAYR